MLIVAQPKSASTSLLVSLSKLTGLVNSCQQFSIGNNDIRDVLPLPEEFLALRGRHKDIAEYPLNLLNSWIDSPLIYKQHVVPSSHNLAILNGKKFVILLRNPSSESYHAYLRVGANPVGDRLTYAIEHREKLIEELQLFNERYAKFSGNILRIYFDDLITNPKLVIGEILSFYKMDIKIPADFQLAKERYSPRI